MIQNHKKTLPMAMALSCLQMVWYRKILLGRHIQHQLKIMKVEISQIPAIFEKKKKKTRQRGLLGVFPYIYSSHCQSLKIPFILVLSIDLLIICICYPAIS